jgi:hypothetical protein
MIADLAFSGRTTVPSDVLWNEVEGELILLDLNTEKYFGLDETGATFWMALNRAPTIEEAYHELSATYQVEPEQLRADLKDLLQELVDRGLLEIQPSEL